VGENVAVDVLDLLVVVALKACLDSFLGCFSALHPCDEQYGRGHTASYAPGPSSSSSSLSSSSAGLARHFLRDHRVGMGTRPGGTCVVLSRGWRGRTLGDAGAWDYRSDDNRWRKDLMEEIHGRSELAEDRCMPCYALPRRCMGSIRPCLPG